MEDEQHDPATTNAQPKDATLPSLPLRRPPGRRRGWIVPALLACLAVLTLGKHLGGVFWAADLLAHFPFQILAALAATALLCAVLRRWRLLAWAALLAALNLHAIAPVWLEAPAGAKAHSARLKLMNCNVHYGKPNIEQVLEALRENDPDVALLIETDPRWWPAVQQSGLPYHRAVGEDRDDPWGFLVLTREPPLSTDIRYLGVCRVPCCEVVVPFDGGELALLCIHPPTPRNAEDSAERNSALEEAAEWARRQTRPHVILGDFNATPWCAAFRALVRGGGLVNSQNGFGPQFSWNVGGPFMIPIDHVLHSRDLTTLDRRIGRDVGSDHRPVLATLAWAEEAR